VPDPYPHKALILAAVSTRGQVRRRNRDGEYEDKYSIPNQLATCRRAIERHGWSNVGEIVIPGHSRRYDFLADLARDCPEYAELLQRIADHQATLLVVAYSDRAQRGTILAGELIVYCARHGVQLYDCSRPREPVPPDEFALTALDKLQASFEGFSAESYVEAFVAKALEGKAARIERRGLHLASRVPFGWQAQGPGLPHIQHPEQARWLRWAWERRTRDLWSWRRIADRLNKFGVRTAYGGAWTRATICRAVCNPYHAGRVAWGDAEGEGKHEPIFSAAEWEELQAANRRLTRDNVRPRAGEFTGLCRCWCGRHCVYYNQRTGLVCTTYHDSRADGEAHNWKYDVAELRAYTIAAIRELLGNLEQYIAWRQQAVVDDAAPLLAQVEQQLSERIAEDRRWGDAYGAGIIDLAEYKARRAGLMQAIRELEAEKRQLENEQARREAVLTEITAFAPSQRELDRLLAALPRLSEDRRRWVYRQLIDHIVLKEGQEPAIRWRR
jgi:hypothetical protein